jgi:hypothetical protein
MRRMLCNFAFTKILVESNFLKCSERINLQVFMVLETKILSSLALLFLVNQNHARKHLIPANFFICCLADEFFFLFIFERSFKEPLFPY